VSVFGDTTQLSTLGYLAAISDSSVYIAPNAVYFNPNQASFANINTVKMNYSNILQVEVKRKGGAGRGILKGSIGGFLAGAIISAISYQEPKNDVERFVSALFLVNRTTTAVAGGMLGALGGSVAGALAGATAKKIFVIGGNKQKFDEMKAKL
jgi:hypothetical protein